MRFALHVQVHHRLVVTLGVDVGAEPDEDAGQVRRAARAAKPHSTKQFGMGETWRGCAPSTLPRSEYTQSPEFGITRQRRLV